MQLNVRFGEPVTLAYQYDPSVTTLKVGGTEYSVPGNHFLELSNLHRVQGLQGCLEYIEAKIAEPKPSALSRFIEFWN